MALCSISRNIDNSLGIVSPHLCRRKGSKQVVSDELERGIKLCEFCGIALVQSAVTLHSQKDYEVISMDVDSWIKSCLFALFLILTSDFHQLKLHETIIF